MRRHPLPSAGDPNQIVKLNSGKYSLFNLAEVKVDGGGLCWLDVSKLLGQKYKKCNHRSKVVDLTGRHPNSFKLLTSNTEFTSIMSDYCDHSAKNPYYKLMFPTDKIKRIEKDKFPEIKLKRYKFNLQRIFVNPVLIPRLLLLLGKEYKRRFCLLVATIARTLVNETSTTLFDIPITIKVINNITCFNVRTLCQHVHYEGKWQNNKSNKKLIESIPITIVKDDSKQVYGSLELLPILINHDSKTMLNFSKKILPYIGFPKFDLN